MNSKERAYKKMGEGGGVVGGTSPAYVKRGEKSWTFILFVFVFLEGVAQFYISNIPFNWCYKLIIFTGVLLFLVYLCLWNTWFQNKIVGLQIKLEDWRKIN